MASSRSEVRPIVLAGGAGSRLWPLAKTRPKPMVPVAGKPILRWVLEAVRDAGFEDATLVVGYKASTVQSAFQDGKDLGLALTYVHQAQQAGTAHAVATALGETGMPEAALVLGGDNVVDAHLIEALRDTGPDALALAKSEQPSKYGVVSVRGERVQRITEKPPVSGDALISTGACLLSRNALDGLAQLVREGVTDLPSVLNGLIDKGVELKGCVTTGDWMDAVYPWDLIPMTELLLAGNVAEVSESATLEADVAIQGPVHIEAGAVLSARSVTVGPTSVGANARIGPAAVVRRSLLFSGAVVGPGAIVEDSVLGEGAKIGAGCVLGAGPATPEADDGLHRVPRLGSIVGEGSTVGPGAVLTPGTVLGNGVTVAAGAVVRGRIPDGGWVTS